MEIPNQYKKIVSQKEKEKNEN